MTAPIAAGIMAAACKYSGFTRSEIKSPSRKSELVRVRHAVMYALTERTAWSLPHIGRYLKRDHSTVIHGRDKTADLMAAAPELAEFVASLLAAPEWIEPVEYVPLRVAPPPPTEIVVVVPPAPKPERISHVLCGGSVQFTTDADGYTDQELWARARLIAGSRNLAQAIREARAA